jgi:hypothetical protein
MVVSLALAGNGRSYWLAHPAALAGRWQAGSTVRNNHARRAGVLQID